MLDGTAGDEVAFLGDDVHVGAERAHIAGRVVAAVERLDHAAVGAQKGLGLDLLRIADDDGLAAAEVESGEGGLVGHALRKVEDIGEGILLGRVRVEPRTAEGRTEIGRIDGDDGLEAGLMVLAEDDLLMVPRERGYSDAISHGSAFCWSWRRSGGGLLHLVTHGVM